LPPVICSATDAGRSLQILKQVDKNLQPEAYEMYRKLINIEPDGSKKEFVLYSVKKGQDKMVALFLSPASEKGRTTLRLGENMWLYIPNVGRPIRITSLQSVVGGVFNNSDILRLDYSAEYDAEGVTEEGDSPLYKGYKSVMIYAKINKKELVDEIFTLNYLSKVDELR
jgi:hypothetical protein